MNAKISLFFIAIFWIILLGAIVLTRAPKVTITDEFSLSKSYFSWKAKEEMVSLLADNGADTVIFGDSTAQGAYIPEMIGPNVYNFSLDGSTPLEGYFF